MTKKYCNMESRKTTKISWSLEDLQQLINDENSHVHFEKAKRHIALHPYHLADLKKSLHEILGAEINYYNHDLKGLLLAYKKPKLLSPIGAILYDAPFIHVDIEADFYVFKPEIGCTLKGIINKKAENHIGVLVHKIFNVSISKSDREEEDWQGNYLDVGEEVTFTVMHVDFKGKLPFIRGELTSSGEGGDDTVTENISRRSKKHQVADEELNFDDGESVGDHSGTNGYISRPKSRELSFLSSFASDSEFEEESKKCNTSSQNDKIKDKRIHNHFEDLDSTQILSNSPKKDKLKKSAEHSSQSKSKKISQSFENEEEEEEEEDVFKKASKTVSRKHQHSDSDTAVSPDTGSKKKKKRLKKIAKSESEEETKSVKKTTTERTESENESLSKNTSKSVEKKLVISRKSYKAHVMSDSEDSDLESSRNLSDKEKNIKAGKSNLSTAEKSPTNSLASLTNKYTAKEINNISMDSDNSVDDFTPFAPPRNIKVEKGLETSYAKAPKVVQNQNEALNSSEIESSKLKNSSLKKKTTKSLDNRASDSDNSANVSFSVKSVKEEKEKSKKTKSKEPTVSEDVESVNSNTNSPKKKSKKSSKNQESESDTEQVPFDVQNVKEEKQKSKKNKSKEVPPSSESESVRSKKVKKEKKDKSKKSKKSNISLEEDGHVTTKKIKKEKEKTITVQSTTILNLQVEDDSDSEPDNLIYNGAMSNTSKIDVQVKEEKMKSEKSKPKTLKSVEVSKESNRESVTSKKIKREEDKSERKNTNKTDESKVIKDTDSSLMFSPVPPKPRKSEKRHKSPDESGELSDASVKSKKKLITKEISVFLGNIKIKQEPMSDVESGSSRKRKREDSISETKSALDIRVKRESSVAKSESTGKLKKIKKDKSLNDSSVKSETNDSNGDDVPRRKKSKTVFTE